MGGAVGPDGHRSRSLKPCACAGLADPPWRHAEPGEMAGAALYLLPDAPSFTTGDIPVIDGDVTV